MCTKLGIILIFLISFRIFVLSLPIRRRDSDIIAGMDFLSVFMRNAEERYYPITKKTQQPYDVYDNFFEYDFNTRRSRFLINTRSTTTELPTTVTTTTKKPKLSVPTLPTIRKIEILTSESPSNLELRTALPPITKHDVMKYIKRKSGKEISDENKKNSENSERNSTSAESSGKNLTNTENSEKKSTNTENSERKSTNTENSEKITRTSENSEKVSKTFEISEKISITSKNSEINSKSREKGQNTSQKIAESPQIVEIFSDTLSSGKNPEENKSETPISQNPEFPRIFQIFSSENSNMDTNLRNEETEPENQSEVKIISVENPSKFVEQMFSSRNSNPNLENIEKELLVAPLRPSSKSPETEQSTKIVENVEIKIQVNSESSAVPIIEPSAIQLNSQNSDFILEEKDPLTVEATEIVESPLILENSGSEDPNYDYDFSSRLTQNKARSISYSAVIQIPADSWSNGKNSTDSNPHGSNTGNMDIQGDSENPKDFQTREDHHYQIRTEVNPRVSWDIPRNSNPENSNRKLGTEKNWMPETPRVWGVQQTTPKVWGQQATTPKVWGTTGKNWGVQETTPKVWGVQQTTPKVWGTTGKNWGVQETTPKVWGVQQTTPKVWGTTGKNWGVQETTPKVWGVQQTTPKVWGTTEKNWGIHENSPKSSWNVQESTSNVWQEPTSKLWGTTEKNWGIQQTTPKVWGTTEKNWGIQENSPKSWNTNRFRRPEENYEVDEVDSVLSNGRIHGIQEKKTGNPNPNGYSTNSGENSNGNSNPNGFGASATGNLNPNGFGTNSGDLNPIGLGGNSNGNVNPNGFGASATGNLNPNGFGTNSGNLNPIGFDGNSNGNVNPNGFGQSEMERNGNPNPNPSVIPNLNDNQKTGYVVEGRNYKKYRVEERTPDGFIVGEYGVVSNNDEKSLRAVRYTADEKINPTLIYDALMKFLAL